jgi:hypothetical protein
MTMPTNGELLASQDIILQIKWTPSTGSVAVSFPQVDHVSILGMLEFAKVSLLEMRAKNEQRVVVPDLRILNGNKLT